VCRGDGSRCLLVERGERAYQLGFDVAEWEVNRAAAVAGHGHGDTMQLCSRFAPTASLVGQSVELIRLI
jgi:hypothetical protein